MRFAEYRYLILSDLYRVTGSTKPSVLVRKMMGGSSYKYMFWIRTCAFARQGGFLRYTLYPIARVSLRRLTYKLGISIPWYTNIGSGFYIGHFGGIVISGGCSIGRNCNISQGVTLGKSNRGEKAGFPTIGDNVYIGPGAKIFGSVRVGANAAIGANCVVVNDVPDGAVVVGVPGRVVSQNGSNGYVNNTAYDDFIS